MSENNAIFPIIRQNWTEILEHVRDEHELTQVSYETWLEPLELRFASDEAVTIAAKERFSLDYVAKRFAMPLKVAISEVTGLTLDVKFVPADESVEEKAPAAEKPSRVGINPRYTFDSFVVGNNNKMAHAAALAVAENPGSTFNPLFLHGGSGLGKTHLMNAIANYILETKPNLSVLCVNSNTFTNEFVDAIRTGDQTALNAMRDKYLNTDVFLMDDIQYIIGRDRTQEEFFETFNTLYEADKQIILTSDRPPKEMELLNERFRSRFAHGLMVDIQSPDYETRMAILQRKRDADASQVSDEVLDYIASNISSNIRELEGALNKLVLFARLEKRAIDTDLAKTALADMVSVTGKREITPSFIIDIVADHFNITPDDIRSNSKARRIAYPRQIAMFLCKQMTGFTLKEIAGFVGLSDHTTVLHGINKITAEMEASDTVKNTIDILVKKINPPED